MANANNRPTFEAEITLGDLKTLTGSKGKYAIARGSKIRHPDGSVQTRTVMAFDDGLNRVARLLRPSRTLRLTVQMDGGTIVIVGPCARPTQPAKAAKAARGTLTQACVDAAGFAEHASYGA